jgi:hypothetical protein
VYENSAGFRFQIPIHAMQNNDHSFEKTVGHGQIFISMNFSSSAQQHYFHNLTEIRLKWGEPVAPNVFNCCWTTLLHKNGVCVIYAIPANYSAMLAIAEQITVQCWQSSESNTTTTKLRP